MAKKSTEKQQKNKSKRKPPVHHWKPGESGNPAGRPPNPMSMTNWLRTIASQPHDKDKTKGQVMAEKVWKRAMEGDRWAMQYVWDRLEGKPGERLELEGNVNMGAEQAVKDLLALFDTWISATFPDKIGEFLEWTKKYRNGSGNGSTLAISGLSATDITLGGGSSATHT